MSNEQNEENLAQLLKKLAEAESARDYYMQRALDKQKELALASDLAIKFAKTICQLNIRSLHADDWFTLLPDNPIKAAAEYLCSVGIMESRRTEWLCYRWVE